MMQSYYTAKVGIAAQQKRVDIIANNIANVNTCAYKGVRADFKDALYSEMQNPEEPGSDVNLLCGNGVLIGATTHNYEQGMIDDTGNDMDFFIDGDGFFTISGNATELKYTRNGSFAVSNENGTGYLVTAQGEYVLDNELKRIEIPENTEGLSVNGNGELYTDESGTFAILNIVTFTNKDGLFVLGHSCYGATDASGEAIASGAEIKQGYLEASNVDLTLELTRLLRAQNAYSLAGKALVISDEMVTTANNLRV